MIRLPGEFEPHEALLLSASELLPLSPDLLRSIVEAASGSVRIVALARNEADRQATRELLRKHGLGGARVRTVLMDHDTQWIRDYGPRFLYRDGEPVAIVDAGYDGDRLADDRVPLEIAERTGLRSVSTDLCIDGGNLLSNGAGLLLSTTVLLEENMSLGKTEDEVQAGLRGTYAADLVVFLEPLSGEPTGHVDMFACFTSATSIVLGRYEVEDDPLNARILDRNAERLAGLLLPDGARLEVHRVGMPPHEDGVFRTHTNVVFANGTLLVPVYGPADRGSQLDALGVFRRLLPRWRIVPLDASEAIRMEGALHCLTQNVPQAWSCR